jgi:hypothetical protein
MKENLIDAGIEDEQDGKVRSIYIKAVKGEEVKGVLLTTTYMENLPKPNYKTKQFTKSITETLPDDISKDDLIKRSDRQSQVVETFVKADIERHIAEAKEQE